MQADKDFRWDYDFVEYGSRPSSYSGDYAYGLTDLDEMGYHAEDDEWSAGSSSSYSSGSRTPSTPISPADYRSPLWESDTETLNSPGRPSASSEDGFTFDIEGRR